MLIKATSQLTNLQLVAQGAGEAWNNYEAMQARRSSVKYPCIAFNIGRAFLDHFCIRRGLMQWPCSMSSCVLL
jgi:hypothetical protein